VLKEGESLWKFIHHLCNKRNVIPEVNDKTIIMFFKKGLMDPSLIRKLTMKNPKSLEEIVVIANKYTMAEEATLDKKEVKKDKKTSQ
jgi:hypothetical protein